MSLDEIGHSWHRSVMRECSRSHFPNLQTPKGHSVVIPFEMLVLDNALHTVIGKFSRHLGLIRFLLANRFYMGFVKKWRHKHIDVFLDHSLKCGVFFNKSYELLLHSSTIILQWKFGSWHLFFTWTIRRYPQRVKLILLWGILAFS